MSPGQIAVLCRVTHKCLTKVEGSNKQVEGDCVCSVTVDH